MSGFSIVVTDCDNSRVATAVLSEERPSPLFPHLSRGSTATILKLTGSMHLNLLMHRQAHVGRSTRCRSIFIDEAHVTAAACRAMNSKLLNAIRI